MTFNVATLQLATSDDFQYNLKKYLDIIDTLESDIIVAPEVYFTDFAYDRFDESVAFSQMALKKIVKKSQNKTLCFTMNVKEDDNYYNQGFIIHNQKIIHTQKKYKLFTIGEEIQHYSAGKKEHIQVVEVGGIKIAMLICFELRFKELWKAIEGVDIILIPAKWGKLRKKHLEILSQALAVMNQSFVVVADSSDEDMAKSSAIISPFGEVVMDDDASVIESECNLEEIKKMRRYLKVYE